MVDIKAVNSISQKFSQNLETAPTSPQNLSQIFRWQRSMIFAKYIKGVDL